MTASQTQDWQSFNQSRLSAALAGVKAVLRRHAELIRPPTGNDHGSPGPAESTCPSDPSQASVWEGRRFPADEGPASDDPPAALDTLRDAFGLSSFERNLLLVCAGIELDSAFAPLCAAAQDDAGRNFPTFSLALAAFPDAHWSALTPDAPLRRWQLIEVGAGPALTVASLRIDERVLHYLVGVPHIDERLAGIVQPVADEGELLPSHHSVAGRIAEAWSSPRQTVSILPVVQLCGTERAAKRAIAASACAALGLNLCVISSHAIPQSAAELDALVRLWEREAVLSTSTLLVESDEPNAGDAAQAGAVSRFVERVRTALMVATRERQDIPRRQSACFDVRRPNAAEQRQVWQHALGAAADLNGQLDELVSQFSLSVSKIHSACANALGRSDPGSSTPNCRSLWDACRIEARSGLDELAQRIESAARWDDLVLPEPQWKTLRQIAMHVRFRATVYESWGFASKGARGLGISALFAGASGTGKTMAAEVLANELRLDLYCIDLSQVVSKYIGETEKNLRRIFDAADESGAILLFDEADALFGKRSEVKDSHDRYANIEVSYLLQRIEAYRGLAILTTNLKSALDAAFLRRLRFVVQFPFPDAPQRAEIWRRIFPAATPTEDLIVSKLARLNIPGGNIRNIAINAAFLAADAGKPVRMHHLLAAARSEYAKLERPFAETEIYE